MQKYDCRYKSKLSVQSQQTSIPILMCDEEIAFTVTKKLSQFTFAETHVEMLFDIGLALQQALDH